MQKGISATVAVVLLIALAMIASVSLFFLSNSLVNPKGDSEKPVVVNIRPVDPARGAFLITNAGTKDTTLAELETDQENVTCSFNGSATLAPGDSAPCYMPPIAGKPIALLGTDENDNAVEPTYVTLGYNDIPTVTFFKTYDGSYSWSTEVVDNTSNVGKYSSIILDSRDKIHIVYYNEDDTDLYHAVYGGSSWSTSLIDSDNPAVDVGTYVDIGIDSKDDLHVSYYDETRRELKHAVYNGTAWTTEGVETGNVSGHTSIDIADDDSIHISYYDGNSRNLKYAKYDEGWTTETVDSGTAVGKDSSIQLSGSVVGIVYWDENNDYLKVADKSGSWDFEVIDNSDGFRHTSLSMGPDFPHVLAWNQSGGGLADFYTGLFIGTWSGKYVDENQNVGEYNSIVLADDMFHASYYDNDNGNLKYAIGGTENTDVWSPQVIDSYGDVGKYTSITNGTNSTLHISYYDETNDILKHAEYSSGQMKLAYAVNDAEGLQWVALKENGITVANSTISNCGSFYTSEYNGFKSSKTYTVSFKNCDGSTSSKTYS